MKKYKMITVAKYLDSNNKDTGKYCLFGSLSGKFLEHGEVIGIYDTEEEAHESFKIQTN